MSQLVESALDPSPFVQFERWFEDAKRAQPDLPEGMTLATAGTDGSVSARVLLLKGFDQHGFVFYTNYNSLKASQLHENPRAAMVFWWPALERQVRIEGAVVKTAEEESDAYFATGAGGGRLGAWASDRSRVIAGGGDLDGRCGKMEATYRDVTIPGPPHWGGYRLIPISIEFWQGRADRLHDRFIYR